MVRTSPCAGLRIGVAEEAVASRRARGRAAGRPECRNRHAPGLAQDIEAGEFQRRQHLRPVVIQRRGGVGDEEAHLLETRRIVAHQIRLHGAEHGFGRFAAAAHFAQADQAVIGFHFDDGADEAAPVAAIGVAQRGFQRHRDGGGPDVLVFAQITFNRTTMDNRGFPKMANRFACVWPALAGRGGVGANSGL